MSYVLGVSEISASQTGNLTKVVVFRPLLSTMNQEIYIQFDTFLLMVYFQFDTISNYYERMLH